MADQIVDRAAAGGGKATALDTSFIARLKFLFTGKGPNEWFGPGVPLPPVAQDAAIGRQFDYPFGGNIAIRPRQGEAIGFDTLRGLAESCDVLRLVIETRKDQVCALPWSIKPRDELAKPDQACKDIEAFFRQPDKEHDWAEWLRMLLEDLFVLDAPTLYARPTGAGELFALEPLDGATIKRLIDVTGRTPMEGPAYQQIIKGLPAVDYTREELIYRPRNLRTHKVYGYGPVEQIITTINTAIRRAMFTLEYFTEGTVPDLIAGVPPEWTPEQIEKFQIYWDQLVAPDAVTLSGARRKMRFIPGGISNQVKELKQPPLKDMFDEWIARVVCYCFSIDATPFVAQVNRSVAETTREQSLSEGLGPTMRWVKGLIDGIIATKFNKPELELGWTEPETVDPVKRMTILKGYVDAKIMHPDEARRKINLDPLTPDQKEDMNPALPPALAGEVGPDGKPIEQAPPGKPGAKRSDESGKPGETPAGSNSAAKSDNGVVVNMAPTEVIVEMPAPIVHVHIDGRIETPRLEGVK